jgi:hypothetical protein
MEMCKFYEQRNLEEFMSPAKKSDADATALVLLKKAPNPSSLQSYTNVFRKVQCIAKEILWLIANFLS